MDMSQRSEGQSLRRVLCIILVLGWCLAMAACAGGRQDDMQDGSMVNDYDPISWQDGPVPVDQSLLDHASTVDLASGDGFTIPSDTFTSDTLSPDSQPPPLDLTGNWNGKWVSGAGLGDGTVTATLQQQGSTVTGPMDVSGVSGNLSSTLTDNLLKGSVANSYAPLSITLTVHNPDHMSGSYVLGPPPSPLPPVQDSGSVDLTRQP